MWCQTTLAGALIFVVNWIRFVEDIKVSEYANTVLPNAKVNRQKCEAFSSALNLRLGFMLFNDEAGSFIQLVECDDFRARRIASEKLE